MKTPIRILGDRVLVDGIADAVEQVKGGIICPGSGKDKQSTVQVIAVGPGKRLANGKLESMTIEVGQFVIVSQYGGTDVKIDDKVYRLLNSDDILATVEVEE
jgi:chaperonin GroES